MLRSAGKGIDSLAVTFVRPLAHPSGFPASQAKSLRRLLNFSSLVRLRRRSNPLLGFLSFSFHNRKASFRMLRSAGKGIDSLAVTFVRPLAHPSGFPASQAKSLRRLLNFSSLVRLRRRSNPLLGFLSFSFHNRKASFRMLRSAGKGTRTLDVQLGKLTLYQLSYSRDKSNIVNVSFSVKYRWRKSRNFLSLEHEFSFWRYRGISCGRSGHGCLLLLGSIRTQKVFLGIVYRLFYSERQAEGRRGALSGTFRHGEGNSRDGVEVFSGKSSATEVSLQVLPGQAPVFAGFPGKHHRKRSLSTVVLIPCFACFQFQRRFEAGYVRSRRFGFRFYDSHALCS